MCRDGYSYSSSSGLSLAAVTLISRTLMHSTVRHHTKSSWDKMVGGAASPAHTLHTLLTLHTLHPAHLTTSTTYSAILPCCYHHTYFSRLHDPHCLTARLESAHTTYTIPSCPHSNICPQTFLFILPLRISTSVLFIYISDIIRRVYSCPSLCHWHSIHSSSQVISGVL